jgi:hypothetical protein
LCGDAAVADFQEEEEMAAIDRYGVKEELGFAMNCGRLISVAMVGSF